MGKWLEHELLNLGNICEYVKDMGYFSKDTELLSEEIGDGNINYIFKVRDVATGKSIILKQADVLLRSSGRPLSTVRAVIESTILKMYNEVAPGYSPEVYGFDENMCIIAMEDVSEFINMRRQMIDKKTFPSFSKDISTFMLKTLVPTLDLFQDAELKKQNVRKMINPELCKISEELVFTEPYNDYRNRNIITPGNEKFVEENLYNDNKLHKEVGKLKEEFMNNAQGLMHGDLHMGSIFINEKGLKVIDPEFAFYGPVGYDVGNVIGNLFFGIAYNRYTDDYSKEYEDWVLESVKDVFNRFKSGLEEEFIPEKVTDLMRKNSDYLKEYIDEIMAYSMGAAGLEIIRRTVGDAKVLELNKMDTGEKKVEVERLLINLGKSFIIDRYKFTNGEDIVEIFEKLTKKGV